MPAFSLASLCTLVKSYRIVRVVRGRRHENDVSMGFRVLRLHRLIEVDHMHRPGHDALVDNAMLDVPCRFEVSGHFVDGRRSQAGVLTTRCRHNSVR